EGESKDDLKRRALDVLRLLGRFQQPELWRHVGDDIAKDGRLDVRGVITSAHVPDLKFFLASGVVSDVTTLCVGGEIYRDDPHRPSVIRHP
ncbi:hypothetical protein LSAT2_017737, partial [Lamellibrachia satsuma]